MGNYTSKSKEVWVKENLDILKLKFNNKEIKDDKNVPISWDIMAYYLGLLYDYKYNGEKIDSNGLRMDPKILECYI